MNCRRYGSRSTLGFWALVLAADSAFVMAGSGTPAVLLLLAVAALVASGVAIARRVTESAPQVAVRRR
jgi:hypothetical protein